MDGFKTHSEAVQVICRICFDEKKLKGDLRSLSGETNQHIA